MISKFLPLTLVAVIACPGAFALGHLPGPAPVPAASHVVIMHLTGYEPAILQIAPGDTVTWVQADQAPVIHTATTVSDVINAQPNSGFMNPGETHTEQFGAGLYVYHCEKHANMVGVIFAN